MRLLAVAAAVLVVVSLPAAQAEPSPATPIRHLVVIYQENVSFDHYFGTYPHATNPVGEPRFVPAPGTPPVDGLTPALLTSNPNLVDPARLDRADLFPCDNLHEYDAEQAAADGGKMDRFVETTGATDARCRASQVMDYYDGNTVTALWEYAQHYALGDAFFGSTYGPSSVGALNLVAGQTHGASPATLPRFVANGTVIGDPDPAGDRCSSQPQVSMSGRNVGDLLDAAGVSWGWFEGGFRSCSAKHANVDGAQETDYVPHHDPFQFYTSTANPQHVPPSSTSAIGHSDAANHQYDLADFWAAADAGNLPAVSFLKAPAYEDGHPGNSDPLDEQVFLVQTIDRLMALKDWSSTAIVIAYDDSDGWYDHAFPPNVEHSADTYDQLYGPGNCGAPVAGAYSDRCGLGPRLPLLVISPYAKQNAVVHTTLEQASILRFVEDNWRLGRLGDGSFDARAASLDAMFDFKGPRAKPLQLDPGTGLPVSSEQPSSPLPPPPSSSSASPPAVPATGTAGKAKQVKVVRSVFRLAHGARLTIALGSILYVDGHVQLRSGRIASRTLRGRVATFRGVATVHGRRVHFTVVVGPATVRVAFPGYTKTLRVLGSSVRTASG